MQSIRKEEEDKIADNLNQVFNIIDLNWIFEMIFEGSSVATNDIEFIKLRINCINDSNLQDNRDLSNAYKLN